MPTTHRLKTLPPFFDAVDRGDKTFEVRKNDRGFQAGDTLELVRYDPNAPHPGEPQEWWATRPMIERAVTYVLPGGQFGLDPEWCVMGLAPIVNTQGFHVTNTGDEEVHVSPANRRETISVNGVELNLGKIRRERAELEVWRGLHARIEQHGYSRAAEFILDAIDVMKALK